MRFAWIDLREVPRPQLQAVVDAAVHTRMAGVVSADAELLGTLPPTVTRVLVPGGPASASAAAPAPKKEAKDSGPAKDSGQPKDAGQPKDPKPGIDVLLRTFTTQDDLDALAAHHRDATGTPVAGFIDVRDDRTLQLSCAGALVLPYTVIHLDRKSVV